MSEEFQPLVLTLSPPDAPDQAVTVEFGATSVTIREANKQPESISIRAASALVAAAEHVRAQTPKDATITQIATEGQ